METYSLYELNEYIRRVIALNFSDAVWINCEISQIKNVRGNYYADLIEQDEKDNVIAQMQAIIWYKNFLFIRSKLGELTTALLTAGSHVKIKVRVDFNERYGMKLLIEDIDPTYTLGRLELNRQKIIERLKQEDVFEYNKSLALPKVIQKIAVISSETAAGYKDFKNHLETNNFGYHYDITLFQSAMQGTNTEKEVGQALDELKESDKFDAIAIIRGGGSKLDLSFFDNFNIGYKIANSDIPVLTGIGHEIDMSIADLVSNKSLKTPTAVADFITDHNAQFEVSINEILIWINNKSVSLIEEGKLDLAHFDQIIKMRPADKLSRQLLNIENIQLNLKQTAFYNINTKKAQLENANQLLKSFDLKSVLKRGFSIVKQKGKYVSRGKAVKAGELEIEFYDKKIITNYGN